MLKILSSYWNLFMWQNSHSLNVFPVENVEKLSFTIFLPLFAEMIVTRLAPWPASACSWPRRLAMAILRRWLRGCPRGSKKSWLIVTSWCRNGLPSVHLKMKFSSPIRIVTDMVQKYPFFSLKFFFLIVIKWNYVVIKTIEIFLYIWVDIHKTS